MRRAVISLGILVLVGGLLVWSEAAAPAPAKQAAAQVPAATQPRVVAAYGKLPLSFEANRGQTDPQVKFLSRGKGYTLFLTSTEAVLSLNSRQSAPRAQRDIRISYSAALASSAVSAPKQRSTVLRMQLVGANPSPQVAGKEELPGKSNYFIGNDPAKWRTNVPHYAKVHYQDVYPGIDLVYYGTNQRQLEYDFIVAPGADPGAIRLAFEGAERLELDAQGDLVAQLNDSELRFQKPRIYQPTGDMMEAKPLSPVAGATGLDSSAFSASSASSPLPGNFLLLANNQVAFEVGPYDPTRPLIIDPVLSYSTFLGGSTFDVSWEIAIDSSGNAYLAGITDSLDFPTTAGVFQPSLGGGDDMFVTKLNAAGDALVYSTYLGGSGTEGFFFGLAVDSSGNAYVTGQTDSADFPTVNPIQAALAGFGDSFVTKLNSTGSALLYSTYLGGSSFDESSSIAVDSSGNAYVTGRTDSADFPTANLFQAVLGGVSDAFVTKFNAAGSALDYSTYLGGAQFESGEGIAVDSSGNAYVTGLTDSADFPTTGGAFQTVFAGGPADVFVTKLNAMGSALDYSTYLGGAQFESGEGIAVDTSGNAYVTGNTNSADFPTANPFQAALSGSGDAFVTKLNAAGSALVYSTYLGGAQFESGEGITVDTSGNAYVTGGTLSDSFPTTGGAFLPNFAGVVDAWIAKLCGALSVDAIILTFGEQAVGTTSAPQSVTLTNTSDSPLTITSVAISGDFDQTHTCFAPLAAGESCTIDVTFTPTATGIRTGELTITDTICGTSSVALTGGLPPPPPPASNDDFANATVIASASLSDSVDTAGATTETGDPTPPCGNGSRSKSVWYQFTPAGPGTVTADTFGSNYDTILSVWTGSPGAFGQVACNDDTGSLQSQVSFAATSGTTYFFMVTAFGNDGGTLVFNLVGPDFSPPSINAGGTVNGASFTPGASVAPGSITSVFGTDLASSTAFAGAVPLPTTLGGATMQFDASLAVPKFFASALQVNIQVPWELAGQAQGSLTDTVSSATSNPETVNLASFAPGLFATNQAGTGQGASLIANSGGTIAAPVGAFPNSRPVMRGTEFISIFCTGLGAVMNQPATGAAASGSPLSTTTTVPTVTIGGVAATVSFSGLAPGFVGLYQVNVQVPAGSPVGNSINVVLNIGGVTANTVTIAVQ